MDKNSIHNLIASNKLDAAFSELLSITANYGGDANTYKKSLIVLSNQFNELKQKKIIGTLTPNEKSILNNQILDRTLNLIDEIFKLIESTSSINAKEQSHSEKIVYNSSDFMLYDNKVTFGTIGHKFHEYNAQSEFDSNKNIIWKLFAKDEEQVGLNIFLDTIKGYVSFDYYPTHFNTTKDNLIFFMIPMKSNDSVIEVGAEIRRDPKNGFSPFRIRKVAKPFSDKWISEKIYFDFSETPEAKESVFAPRINEGCPRVGNGGFKIRNVKVFSIK